MILTSYLSCLSSSIHKSEKGVRDGAYWTMTELFGTKWKLPRELDKDHYDIDSNEMEDESEVDADTLPTRKNMQKTLKKLRHIL